MIRQILLKKLWKLINLDYHLIEMYYDPYQIHLLKDKKKSIKRP